MKAILVFLFLLFTSTIMNAQDQDPWAEYMTPSAIHSLLSQYTGSFTMEITMSMGEGNEPTVITVDSEHQMLLGGRFLEMKQQGLMMGMEYQAMMTLGFNNTDKKMALTTITNMGTGTLSLYGDWNENTNSAILLGTLTNPVSKSTINVKQVITFVDNNILLIESFDKEGDKPEIKTVQYKLIRKV
ncbi:DUF1579 family protein [Peijinzhouia sedimentorum]